MSNRRQWRTRMLAGVCGSVAVAAGLVLFHPHAGSRPVPLYHFPEVVPLAGWEPAGTETLRERRAPSARVSESVQSGRRYRYVSNGIPLEAEIRYLTGSLGNIKLNLRDQTAIPARVFQRAHVSHHDGTGYYGLFAHEARAYLTTCINPRGGATVTADQFVQNHRAHDYSADRVWRWLLGRECLRDYRCLWVTLSTPLNGEGPEAAYRRLETAWADWGGWWLPRFPGYSVQGFQ